MSVTHHKPSKRWSPPCNDVSTYSSPTLLSHLDLIVYHSCPFLSHVLRTILRHCILTLVQKVSASGDPRPWDSRPLEWVDHCRISKLPFQCYFGWMYNSFFPWTFPLLTNLIHFQTDPLSRVVICKYLSSLQSCLASKKLDQLDQVMQQAKK